MKIVEQLEVSVYFEDALLDWKKDQLPGFVLAQALDHVFENESPLRITDKLEVSCRKLCHMQHAVNKAREAIDQVYLTTYRDAMAWFGSEEAELNFYLEASVMFARSALDVASAIFSHLLPSPLSRTREDSFNKLTKRLSRAHFHPADDTPVARLARTCRRLRSGDEAWFGWLVGQERGRGLRDKLAHQTQFPVTSIELQPGSERETLVLSLDESYVRPEDFFTSLVNGTCEVYRRFELVGVSYLYSLDTAQLAELRNSSLN